MPNPAALLRSSLALCLALATTTWASAQCTPEWQMGEPTAALTGSAYCSLVWDPDGAGPAPSLFVVGGSGLCAGEVWLASLAAWDGTQWRLLGRPPAGEITSLASYNGALVAVLKDTAANRIRVERWDGSAWTTIGTCGAVSSAGATGTLLVHQGTLYVGGNFPQIDNVPAQFLAQYTGSGWAAVGAGPQYPVSQMASFASALWVATNRTLAPPLGQVETWSGTSWTVVASANSYIDAMATRIGTALTNSYLYVGGIFNQFTGSNGTLAGPLVRFSPTANTWSSLAFTPSTQVRDIRTRATGLNSFELVVVGPGGLYQSVSGGWTQLGGSVLSAYRANYSGGWNLLNLSGPAVQRLQSGAWTPLTSTFTPLGRVLAVRDAGNDLVVGGAFGLLQGQPANWTPIGGLTGYVDRIARLASGDLVVCGTFTAPGLPANTRIARWNGSTWSLLAATMSLSGAVLATQPLPNGDLVVGGSFTSIAGAAIPYLARWNGSSWQPLGGGVNNTVRALVRLPNGDLVAGGDFTLAGTVTGTALYAARWNGSTWSPMSGYSAIQSLSLDSHGVLRGLMQTDGVFEWLGAFWGLQNTTLGQAMLGLPNGDSYLFGQNQFSHLDGTGSARSSSTFLATIDDLWLAANGDALVAGDFGGISPIASVGVARRRPPCPATTTSYGTSCTGPGGTMVLQATDQPWTGGVYRAVTTGFTASMLGIDLLGLQPQATPLPTLVPGSSNCDLLVQPLATALLTPVAGSTSHQLVMPTTPDFVGVTLLDQVLGVDLSTPAPRLHGSNGLQVRIGIQH